MLPPFKGYILHNMRYYSLTVKVFPLNHPTSVTEVTSNYMMGKIRKVLEPGGERKKKKQEGVRRRETTS